MYNGLMDGLEKLFSKIPQATLARELGVSKQAVNQWVRVPNERIQDVSKLTGLTPAELRPDLVKLLE